MSKINWKKRFKNPIFWVNTLLAIATPILAYFGMNGQDLTTWESLFNLVLNALKNPYVLGLVLVSLWNNIINPVTKGITD
ncbi:phage holin [[Clostridium] colinum]|uniref:phage holin n=1 Tax=[Clostridium] colinum TaxID=36835 RepID=UPI0020254358|nr:phage holin [[Clostridium] colinum]